jgi:K+-transporting ATPase c subunit
MMMYDIQMHLNSFNTIINDGYEYISTIFNISTQKKRVYKARSCSNSTFMNNLQIIIQESLEHYRVIIMGDFNVDILKINNQQKK